MFEFHHGLGCACGWVSAVIASAVVGVARCSGDVSFDFVAIFFVVKLRNLAWGAGGVGADIFGFDLDEVGSTEVAEGEFAEDIVNDRGGHFDIFVTGDRAVGLESGEYKRLDELF